MEMGQQHDQGIADAADLFSVRADIRQHVFLDFRRAGLAEIDIDQSELAADRTEERTPRAEGLNDVSGQWQFEDRHNEILWMQLQHEMRSKNHSSDWLFRQVRNQVRNQGARASWLAK